MAKSKGSDCEVRIAAAEADLAAAPVVPYIDHVEWDVDQAVEQTPRGHGYRGQEVKEGLVAISGSIVRAFDATVVIGASSFANSVQAYVTGALSYRYIQVKNLITGTITTLKKVKGKYNRASDTDGYVTETYDFQAEDVAET